MKVSLPIFLLAIVLVAFNAPQIMGANAGGYFCKGCNVIMEHTFHGLVAKMKKLQRTITAGVEKEVSVKINNLLYVFLFLYIALI